VNRKQTFRATQSLIRHQPPLPLVKQVPVLLDERLQTPMYAEWLPNSLTYDISDRLIELIDQLAAIREGEVFGTTPI